MDDDARRLELSPSLRQLCHPDLDPLFWLPERRGAFSAWWGHVPFAHWVMRAARPGVMVELGTHWGVSYAAFCQAVVRCRLNTRCFAVDTWKGDPHASFYEEGVYEDFRAFHDQRYAAFSSLLRCTFDEALDRIEDGSVDLLHLDGLHTYDAVRHDFQSWLPKFSARGVALLHDINVHRDDFGVWRLWHELREQHPHFEFHHCYGLGVLALGKEPPEAIAELCALNDREEGAALRSRVALMGDHWIAEAREHDLRAELASQQRAHAEAVAAAAATAAAAEAAARSEAEVLARAAHTERARLQDALAAAEKTLDRANADTERRKASIVELQTQKAAFAHELQTQTAIFAEQRDQLERDVAALRARVQQLEVIEQSTTWRATRVLRGAASRVPRPLRSALRRTAKAGYWALTPHRMPARIRFLRDRRHGAPAPAPAPQSPIDVETAAKMDPLRLSWGEEALPEAPPRSEPVDIVVCVHNALEDVRQCLYSVVECTQQPYRLIIVDDGSAGETRDYLADFAAAHDIVLIRNENALGYTGAANCGLRASDARWVVLLNSDTIVTKPWLDAMWSHGWRDPNIGIIGPLSNTASWQSVPLLSEDGDWAKNPPPAGMTPQDVADLVRDAAVGARSIPFLNGFCYMIRREVIDRIGIFDEQNFANYGEENDYSIRARQAGYRLVVATDAYVFHNSSRSYSPERRRAHQDRANQALAARHDPTLHISPQVEYCQTSLVFTSLRARVGAALRRRQLVETGRRKFAGRRVAFMLPVTEYGGGANVVLQEAKAMAAMGVKVTVLNLAAYQQALAKHATPNGRFLTFPDETALRAHLARLPVPYDVVVGTYYGSVYWLPKQRPPECAYGYYIQDFEPLFFPEADERYQYALLSYTAHKDLRLITKTAWNQRAVADATGRVPTVIGCSVNLDLFAPAEERARAPIDRPLRIAAMLRPASAYRAPARTLAVFEEVLRRYPTRVTVHTFGTSDDQLAANCLARPWITNHGHLPPERVAALLAHCDIFVDFSDYQAMGLSLLEAMASGCAVVGPISGGATAFLHDGVNGLLADTTSIDDCVEKTVRLVGDRDLRGNLQRRAIDDANTHVPEAAALNILNALFTPARVLIGGIS